MVKIVNSTRQNFKKLIHNKKIICFCGGKRFQILCSQFDIVHNLLYVIDNYKAGMNIMIDGITVPVLSMKNVTCEMKECIFVLSTLRYADEIIPQLDVMEQLNDIEIYVPELFLDSYSEIQIKKWKQIIPKKIHYFWLGKKEVPLEFQRNIESWKHNCPDYEIIQWNENNYDISKNKYMYQAYKQGKFGFVPDFARLDIINTYGGLYFDTDVFMLKSFDDLLGYGMFCGFETPSYVNLGHGFGAKKEHPIIEKMLKVYEHIEFIDQKGNFNLTPSPEYQTKVLEELGLEKNGEGQQINDCIILPPEYFAPVNAYGYGHPTINTFSIHQFAASWYDSKAREMKDRIERNYQYVIMRMEN